MKAEYINPFVSATRNVLETMAKIECMPGSPVLKSDNLSWGIISGVIGLASSQLKGNMIISFDLGCILAIVDNMLNETFTEITQEVVDAVGEITNMISGGAKRELSEMGYTFEMAIPVMILGQKIEITQLSGPCISIPFTTPHGNFVVEANLAVEKS